MNVRTGLCAALAALSLAGGVLWAQPIVPTRLPCTVKPTVTPLQGGASALLADRGTLYIGRPDSSITVYDIKSHASYAIRCADAPGRPTAISAGDGGVWWVTDSPQRLLSFRAPDREVTCWDLSVDSSIAPVRGLCCWRGMIVLLQDRGARLFDPNTCEALPLESVFPADTASGLNESSLNMTVEDGKLLIAAARQGENGIVVSFYEVSNDTVSSRGSWTTPETPRALGLSSKWCAGVGQTGAYACAMSDPDAQTKAMPIPRGAYGGNGAVSAGVSGDHLWWTVSSILFHAALDTDFIAAYMPWNEKDLAARLVAATPDGDAWVATGTDIRRVSITKVDETTGHSGFVRADLRVRGAAELTGPETTLAAIAADWQGTSYKWGGATKDGTDCSGFVLAAYKELGVTLPHGSASLATCAHGTIVHDEIKIGDVLVEPGHASLYLGGGRTAETLSKVGLGYGVIWNKRGVIVQRFIGAEDGPGSKPAIRPVVSRPPARRPTPSPKPSPPITAHKPAPKPSRRNRSMPSSRRRSLGPRGATSC